MSKVTELGNNLVRLEEESDADYNAFMVYVLLPEPKSFKKVADTLGKTTAWASQLAKKHDWKRRAVKSESQQMVNLAIMRDQELAKRADDLAMERIEVSEMSIALLRIEMEKALQEATNTTDRTMSTQELTRALPDWNKASRLEFGQPGSINELKKIQTIEFKNDMLIKVPPPQMVDENFEDIDVEEAEFTLEELKELKPGDF